jgi:hypothetical protein
LHRIYYAERDFHKEHNHYARTLQELGLGDLQDRTLIGRPLLEVNGSGYQASADVRYPDGSRRRWNIREDSRIWPSPRSGEQK